MGKDTQDPKNCVHAQYTNIMWNFNNEQCHDLPRNDEVKTLRR